MYNSLHYSEEIHISSLKSDCWDSNIFSRIIISCCLYNDTVIPEFWDNDILMSTCDSSCLFFKFVRFCLIVCSSFTVIVSKALHTASYYINIDKG